jgi:hypothetical protein
MGALNLSGVAGLGRDGSLAGVPDLQIYNRWLTAIGADHNGDVWPN